jgi:hypothetical protein
LCTWDLSTRNLKRYPKQRRKKKKKKKTEKTEEAKKKKKKNMRLTYRLA